MLRKVIWLRGQTSALFASVSCLVSSRQSFRTVSLRSGLPFQLVAWCLYVLAVISDNNWSLSQLSCFYRKIAGEVAIFFILYQNVIHQHSFNPFFVRIYHIHFLAGCHKKQLNQDYYGFVVFSFWGFLCYLGCCNFALSVP